MTEPAKVYQIIYDESLHQQIQPIRDEFRRHAQAIHRLVPDGPRREQVLAGLAEDEYACELQVFDHLAGRIDDHKRP